MCLNAERMKNLHCSLSPPERASEPNELCAVTIMTKAPRPGEVKTRLTPPLTAEEAACLNICFLRDIADAVLAAGDGIAPIGCFTPPDAAEIYEGILPREFKLLPQRGADLTERLICAVDDLFALGFFSVCLIGSDTPKVPAAVYAEAVTMLALPGDRVVLGPADDGGYYLIGLKKPHHSLFQEIEWSTAKVFLETVRKVRELDVPIHLLAQSYDVDDRATLIRLCRDLVDDDRNEKGITANATRDFLREIINREGRGRIYPESL